MIRFPTRRLSIALLAQVVFCLVAAPVIAAQQWAVLPARVADDAKAPRDAGVTIQAAFDASNVRPEEVSEAEQKKGRPRGGVHRTGGQTGATEQRAAVGSALADALSSTIAQQNPVRHGAWEPFLWHGFTTRVLATKTRVGNPRHELILKLQRGSYDGAFANFPDVGQLPTVDASIRLNSYRSGEVLRKSPRDHTPAVQPIGPPLV